MSAKRKPYAASLKIAQEIVKKYDSEYTLVSLIAEAITAGHAAPAVEAVGEMWSPEDAVEDAPRHWMGPRQEVKRGEDAPRVKCSNCNADYDPKWAGTSCIECDQVIGEMCATPRTPLLERAASWKESDLRKFPAATLELIDALAAALRAAPAGPTTHTRLLTMSMILDALEVMEREGYTKPKFGGLGTVRFTDLLNAALRSATPAPRETTGELESWVRLVPHVGHKEFKGSFESTTEFEPFCVRCNLEKLTRGPTIDDVCKGRSDA